MNSAFLGAEEGQTPNVTCPPGSVKVFLPDFPWQKCVPESEILPQGEPAPAMEIAPAAPPSRPGKARFLRVDAETGNILDPDTGNVVKPVYNLNDSSLFTTETVILAGVGVGILALVLVMTKAFK